MSGFSLFFDEVPDPRAGNAQHELSELLFIAIAAMLCGAESCQDMADFGQSKRSTLRKVLRLRHGIPSHDTFSRVFRLLDPVAFEAAFRKFIAAFAAQLAGDATPAQIIALDGKSLRGAFQKGARATPLHLVTAWACDQRLVLAQRKAPGRAEVAAALELVAMLDLEGATVTADALHGNRRMAAAVRERKGGYVLALKGNRGPLFHASKALLADAEPGASSAGLQHGREETRSAMVQPVPADWPSRFRFKDLAAIGRIDSLRRIDPAKKPQISTRFFVLSSVLAADELLRIVRAHWTIENQQHWLLDVVLDEDRARSRRDNAAENLALLRRLALNLLQSDTFKASIRRKIKRAGWDEAYLFTLLSHMR